MSPADEKAVAPSGARCFSRRGEQCAVAEGAQRDFMPPVTFYNGKAPARSSRAAQEWYGRCVAWNPSTKWAPLCPPLCGFFSIIAILTTKL